MTTADTIRQALQCDNPSCACHKSSGNVHCPAHTDSTPSLKGNRKPKTQREIDPGRRLLNVK
jgi:hypothetical protein